ncbi:hypothetical protein CLV56_3768 [Mumia flava]|uniref:Uncharacterized protein n=1 Tax=Mumia flava TaxID=1348852 RepID=A0A0B2BHM7_9ACTN|nr:hypothetical protein [Mumia flava]PJJ54260.1 hypothetical protein CLV56_3768 [Mumia flava]
MSTLGDHAGGILFGIGSGVFAFAISVPWSCTTDGSAAAVERDLTITYDPGTVMCSNLLGTNAFTYSGGAATAVAFFVAFVVWGVFEVAGHWRDKRQGAT